MRARDSQDASDTQTYTVVVQAGNGPPRFVSTPPTSMVRLEPYLYDCHALDPEGDPLLYSIEIGPAGMTLDPLTCIVEWTPTENGTYGVTLRVEDTAGGFDEQTFAVLVTDSASNSPPIAGPDFYQTDEDTPLIVASAVGLLRNDSDPEADALRSVLVAPPEHGNLILEADGAFSYLPEPNFSGRDSFEYRATELAGSGASAPTRVEIFVVPANDAPAIVTTLSTSV